MITVRSAYSGQHSSSAQTVLAGERLYITLTLDASELKGRCWQAADLASNHFRADLIASAAQADSIATPTASSLRRRSSILLGSRDVPSPRVRCECDGVVVEVELQLGLPSLLTIKFSVFAWFIRTGFKLHRHATDVPQSKCSACRVHRQSH
jgi:hypothetical protein